MENITVTDNPIAFDGMNPDSFFVVYLALLAARNLDPADESSMRAHVMAYGDADAAGVIFA